MVSSAVGGPADGATIDGSSNATSVVAWRQLSERAVTIWRLRAALTLGGVLIAFAAVLGAVLAVAPFPSVGVDVVDGALTTSRIAGLLASLATFSVVVAAGMTAMAPRRFLRFRWRVDGDTLLVERGWWRHRRAQVPIAEIHTLSERAGPLLRRWHVQKVRAFASGPVGSVSVPIVDADDVAILRCKLGFDDDEH